LHGKILLVAMLVGEACLAVDLSNRLFGSYVRNAARVAWRVLVIVAACCALAAPAVLGALLGGARGRSAGLWVSGVAGAVVALHFLFPYRFGISRLGRAASGGQFKQLCPGARLRIERFVSDLLPAAADGFECLVLSDLHCNTDRNLRLLRRVVEALAREAADAVFILGDLGEREALLPEVFAALSDLPERRGKFLVRSNHDFEGGRGALVRELASRHGIRLLSNRAVDLPAAGVSVVGLESPWRPGELRPAPGQPFAIGLAHTPDNISRFARLGVELALAGHTHGGAARLPLVGPLLVPSRHGRFLDRGWFRRGETSLFITEGFGYGAGAFGLEAEVVRLTLRRGQPEGRRRA